MLLAKTTSLRTPRGGRPWSESTSESIYIKRFSKHVHSPRQRSGVGSNDIAPDAERRTAVEREYIGVDLHKALFQACALASTAERRWAQRHRSGRREEDGRGAM